MYNVHNRQAGLHLSYVFFGQSQLLDLNLNQKDQQVEVVVTPYYVLRRKKKEQVMRQCSGPMRCNDLK